MSQMKSIFGGWNTKQTIHRNEQGTFLKRLGELKAHGYPLKNAIEFLLLNQKKHLEGLHQDVIEDFLNGQSLSDTLKKLGFPSFVCLHIYFAERYGNVEETLLETSTLLQHRRREMKRLVGLLYYPIFLSLLFVVIVMVLNFYLLPRFTTLYATIGQNSSGFVRWISSFFNQLPFIMFFVWLIFIFIGLLIIVFMRNLDPHERWSKLSAVPVIGYYVQHYHSYVFSREASHLLKGGMSIQAMLQTFMAQPYRKLYHDMAAFMSGELERGQTMHQTLLQLPYITDELKRITHHGEENGRLEEEWQFYSNYCLASLEERTTKILVFIQPCLFLLLGVAIISAYLIILLPTFQLMQTI
ncbi:competence type IV pilus assembly protein ComGB [Jeotgalibacillus marinus]|uniref:Competence type IV pilus assembly protein ComGB n=1 Tax=Jeotgalibacillus marinus TaxID=86667 RepID=A0ABV3PZE0_9BACL